MLTIEEIRVALRDSNLMKVSHSSGVSYGALNRLMKGADPMYSTYKKLNDYLESKNVITGI